MALCIAHAAALACLVWVMQGMGDTHSLHIIAYYHPVTQATVCCQYAACG